MTDAGRTGLKLSGISYTYPGYAPTLVRVDLQVNKGENVFLLGPSGTGKSTLLRIVCGLLQPDAGSVFWQGDDLGPVPAEQRRIGMVFQEPALFQHLDVLRNVAWGYRYRPDSPRWPARRALERAEAEAQLRAMQIPTEAWRRRPDTLSGGQRQRVALARTLAAGPRAVLLDEPFSGLDKALRARLGPDVRHRLRETQVAALWVTHDRDEAFALADAVYELVDGRLEKRTSDNRAGHS